MGKKQAENTAALATSRSNYEVEQTTMPYIDEADAEFIVAGKVKPIKRLSQVRERNPR